MNSKFLKICEKIRTHLNEQNLNEVDPTANEQPTPNISPDTESTTNTPSDIPVLTNQEIVSVVNGLRNFYSEKKELTSNEIDAIKALPTDTSDSSVKKIIDTLNNIFNPVKIDTKPENIENSNFSS
jgi:DNA/RNA endonuclease YhcR with UshA esterase domain